jgi:hypothetical protein
VDSCSHASALWSSVVQHAGGTPIFWGRYVGTSQCPLYTSEISYLHGGNPAGENCKILLIANTVTPSTVSTSAQGKYAALLAYSQANRLGAPSGTAIFADLEQWVPTQAWFSGWAYSINGAKYVPGVYFNPAAPNSNWTAGSHFCKAHANHPSLIVYSAEPQLDSYSSKKSGAPAWNPDPAKSSANGQTCATPVAWQYKESDQMGTHYDVDLATSLAFMW